MDDYTKAKIWKLHLYLNPRNCNKELEKKNMLGMDLGNQVKINSYVDEKIVCNPLWREVNMSNLHQREEKEMTKLFHIKI
jgi:5'(3')-deoxyribonucleotidase